MSAGRGRGLTKPGFEDRPVAAYPAAAAMARGLLTTSQLWSTRRLLWRFAPALAEARHRLEHAFGYRIPSVVPVLVSGRTIRLSGESWSGIASGIWWGGAAGFEPAETRLLVARAPLYRVVLDVGANVGWFGLVVSVHAKACAVHAFEPNPAVAQLLRANFALNDVRGTVEGVAVSDGPGTARLFVHPDDWASSLRELGDAREAIEVPVLTIDGYVRSKSLTPDLIKIDVEGAEDRVLAGAAATLAEAGPDVLFEVTPAATSVEGVRQLLARCGYERFWTFRNGAPVRDDQMALAAGRNVINYFTSRRSAPEGLPVEGPST